jgi:hypothetical protein
MARIHTSAEFGWLQAWSREGNSDANGPERNRADGISRFTLRMKDGRGEGIGVLWDRSEIRTQAARLAPVDRKGWRVVVDGVPIYNVKAQP